MCTNSQKTDKEKQNKNKQAHYLVYRQECCTITLISGIYSKMLQVNKPDKVSHPPQVASFSGSYLQTPQLCKGLFFGMGSHKLVVD